MRAIFSGGFQGLIGRCSAVAVIAVCRNHAPLATRPKYRSRHLVETADVSLEISGRIDGIFSLDRPITIEEIKTTTQDSRSSPGITCCIGARPNVTPTFIPTSTTCPRYRSN
ncbi:MAG: hypothetical protein U0401_17420 [Anaerolineae bacterium]